MEKYLNINIVNRWLVFNIPILESKCSFAVHRQVCKEIKALDSTVKVHGLKGWVAHTLTINEHVMIMLTKFGAVPYRIDIKEKKIWFKKERVDGDL